MTLNWANEGSSRPTPEFPVLVMEENFACRPLTVGELRSASGRLLVFVVHVFVGLGVGSRDQK